jgi:hypothetical protein
MRGWLGKKTALTQETEMAAKNTKKHKDET